MGRIVVQQCVHRRVYVILLRESRKEERMGKNEKLESLYQDKLPQEILEELTPEVRRQYFLWDEIMKREIQLYPRLIVPVVKEIFHREYSADRNIVLLSTEYTVSRVYEKGEKLLQAIRSDILIKIAADMYHFECQIEKDGKMVFRMFEYDVHIALTHGKTIQKSEDQSGGFSVSFPRSAVLYLGESGNMPEYETCALYFQDGTSHLYRIPVMRVQSYSPGEIEQKHLNILIPFLLIRFREQIKEVSEKNREQVKRKLTGFILECLTILKCEEERGILSETARKDIGEFLWKVCGYLLEGNTVLYREVSAEVEPAIKLSREVIQELKEDIKELQQEMEDACRRMIEKLEKEGKSAKEAKEDLMTIFALTEEEAEEKVSACWR